MLYKFKSQAAPDVIMMQPQAEELLAIIGKEPGPRGIVTVAQVAPAVAALRAEMERREAAGHETRSDDDEEHDDAENVSDDISLRRRAAPFIKLLEMSAAAGKDVVWGV